jgi:hypothetical protein
MNDEEITAEYLKESINDIIEDLKQIKFIIDYGATNGEYSNAREQLIKNFNGFIKDLKKYVDNETFKELERIEYEIKNS